MTFTAYQNPTALIYENINWKTSHTQNTFFVDIETTENTFFLQNKVFFPEHMTVKKVYITSGGHFENGGIF